MRMEELKRGFWGYTRESVYRCITAMEEEFSARLLEKDAAVTRLEEQYQGRIRELEESLAQVQREGEAQRRDQATISEALLNAQEYARGLREETQRQEEEVRRELDAQIQRQRRELEAYQGELKRLRETFQALLEEMDGRMEALYAVAPRLEPDDCACGGMERQVV